MSNQFVSMSVIPLFLLSVGTAWAQVTETRKPTLPSGTNASRINLEQHHVHDAARIFSAETVRDAEQQIGALQRRYHHGVTIETFESVKAEKRVDVEKLSAAEKNRFYRDWLKERAVGEHAEGLFVLITKHPGHVQVGVSSRLHSAGFTEAAKQDVLQALVADFKDQQYDRGLVTALEKVKARFAQLKSSSSSAYHPTPVATGPQPPAKPVQGWSAGSWLLIAAVVIGGFMLLSRLGRTASPAHLGGAPYPGGGPAAGGYGGGGQGGGFFGNMMGGLFGAMAGNWLYNSFSGQSAQAADRRPNTDSGRDITDTTSDTWDSSGSDFDNNGGDFGGGGDDNSSGGDF